ncbi:type IV pilus modification PilV family protein [Marinicrinis sediminis]|uniref:Prepilin-type N-terminal cleavage/methylation domain-containing protein n=1 Tax=Marinicrinis sediminis TaxID=1652465 RepID=A0ABW5RET9_9BACL
MSMSRKRLARLNQNEQGMTLIEILVAVTIMSIVSVWIAGYFVSAMEKSADQSREGIAANLAKMKLGQIRDQLGLKGPYTVLQGELSGVAGGVLKWEEPDDLPASLSSIIDIQPVALNETTYHYQVDIGQDARMQTLQTGLDSLTDPYGIDDYMMPIQVTVKWDKKSVQLRAYIRNKGSS